MARAYWLNPGENCPGRGALDAGGVPWCRRNGTVWSATGGGGDDLAPGPNRWRYVGSFIPKKAVKATENTENTENTEKAMY